MGDNYGFTQNDPNTIRILKSVRVPKKCIQGTPWYQILSNPKYAGAFNYIGAHIFEREKLIEDGFANEKDPEVYEEQKAIRCE